MVQIKTINLKGKAYAQVGDRVNAFHQTYKNGSIRTDLNITGNTAIIKATVIPDVENEKRYFQGSALSVSLNKEKGLEKLETTAIGRALAMAGFATDGQIASYEEIERFENNNSQTQKPQNSSKQNFENSPKIDVWMSQNQFEKLMQTDNLKIIKTVLNSKTTKDGKTFGIKKEYRQKLQEKLNNV